MWTRVASVVLGAWTFISAFLWPHDEAQFHTAWVSGSLIVVGAAAAYAGHLWGRVLQATVGAWLLISWLFTSWGHTFTVTNDLVVGVLAIALALAPIVRPATRRAPRLERFALLR